MACQHGIWAILPSMGEAAVTVSLSSLPPGGQTRFSLLDVPFDEVLLSLHVGRFTGVVEVGTGPEVDRVFLREGAVVGLRARPSVDRALLLDSLQALKLASPEAAAAAMDDAPDGLALGQHLIDAGLVSANDLDRAAEEAARRRLFAIYDDDTQPVRVAQGMERLAHFHPVFVDVRPAIAFGMVVRAGDDRKIAMVEKVRGRTVQLVAPYDESRNGYGLPPPVLLALRDLSRGVTLNGGDVLLPGLSASETAGVLLLLDRMSLLKLV
jgi:hypothetical protein